MAQHPPALPRVVLGIGLAASIATPASAQILDLPRLPEVPPHAAPPPGAADAELPEPMVGPLRARLQERLDAHREAAGAPGAALAVVLPGGQELGVCSGLSRRADPSSPLTSGDRMLSGSVGKTYCAAIAMLLTEEGTLDLDAPIARYIGDRDWFSRLPSADAITARMLLNHTSGLREHVTSPAFIDALRAHPDRDWTPEQLVAFALDQAPLFPAGQGWSYADTNYVLLGLIIEAITGSAYNDLLRDRLLEPLGLVFTDPSDRPDLWGLIPGYTDPANPFGFPEQTAHDETYCVNPQFEYTGGGTITTAADLARWADHLYAGRVVSTDSLGQMGQGVTCSLGPDIRYGLGTIIWPSAHGPAWGHSGWFPGYITMVRRYQDLGITIAYQQNTDVRANPVAIGRLLDAVAGLVHTTLERVPAAPDPAPVPQHTPGDPNSPADAPAPPGTPTGS